jgi:hypothetical protein
VVVVRAIEIGRHVHASNPQFAVGYKAIRINQTGFSKSDALDFRSRQHNASSKGLDEEIFKRGFFVSYVYRTFLPDQFFFLIHINA